MRAQSVSNVFRNRYYFYESAFFAVMLLTTFGNFGISIAILFLAQNTMKIAAIAQTMMTRTITTIITIVARVAV